MKHQETQQKFVDLRERGRSFARIAEELQVSKRTLIEWSRKFQFEIQNQRAIKLEALRERYLAGREELVRQLGERLREVEAEVGRAPGRGAFHAAPVRAFRIAPPSARPCNPSTPTSITTKRRIGRHEQCVPFAIRAASVFHPWLMNGWLTSIPRHSLTRGLKRRLRPSLTRRCCRRTARRVGRCPRLNYLAQTLTAFNRALRARCRLMRLAPEIFDSAVVQRQAAEREVRRPRRAELEPILQKVYGPAADPASEKLHHAQSDEWCRNGAEMVQFSQRKIQKIESLLAERELWMTIGTAALDRYQNLQPHRHVSLSLADRVIDLASQLGRLALGMEFRPRPADKHPPDELSFWNQNVTEALHRTYGDSDQTSPSAAPFIRASAWRPRIASNTDGTAASLN